MPSATTTDSSTWSMRRKRPLVAAPRDISFDNHRQKKTIVDVHCGCHHCGRRDRATICVFYYYSAHAQSLSLPVCNSNAFVFFLSGIHDVMVATTILSSWHFRFRSNNMDNPLMIYDYPLFIVVPQVRSKTKKCHFSSRFVAEFCLR